jgi:hypothetical protein
MIQAKEKCVCVTIELDIEFNQDLKSLVPRKCDCDFCCENNLVYISDPLGKVKLSVGEIDDFQIVRQGSQTADFLSCKQCNNILLVVYQDNEKTFCALNYQLLDNKIYFNKVITVSPKLLSPKEKQARWKQVWFNRVDLAD